VIDISLTGATFEAQGELPEWADQGIWLALAVQGVGDIPAQVVRRNSQALGMRFNLQPSPERDRLIRKIFTTGLDNTTANDDAFIITVAMLSSIFRSPSKPAAPQGAGTESGQTADRQAPPPALLAEIEARSRDIERWDADLASERRAHAVSSHDAA
jgi:cellulose synthase (UDP-forming)